MLENGVNTLRTMIQQGGTGEAAVVQFLEKLERWEVIDKRIET